MVGEHLVKRLVERADATGCDRSDTSTTIRSAHAPAPADESLPVLGGPDDLAAAVERTGARHVILAFSTEPDHVLVDRVRECERLGVEVSLVPRLYESINDRTTLDHVGGLPLLTLRPTDPRGWQFAVKHAFDRAFAVAGARRCSRR